MLCSKLSQSSMGPDIKGKKYLREISHPISQTRVTSFREQKLGLNHHISTGHQSAGETNGMICVCRLEVARGVSVLQVEPPWTLNRRQNHQHFQGTLKTKHGQTIGAWRKPQWIIFQVIYNTKSTFTGLLTNPGNTVDRILGCQVLICSGDDQLCSMKFLMEISKWI